MVIQSEPRREDAAERVDELLLVVEQEGRIRKRRERMRARALFDISKR